MAASADRLTARAEALRSAAHPDRDLDISRDRLSAVRKLTAQARDCAEKATADIRVYDASYAWTCVTVKVSRAAVMESRELLACVETAFSQTTIKLSSVAGVRITFKGTMLDGEQRPQELTALKMTGN